IQGSFLARPVLFALWRLEYTLFIVLYPTRPASFFESASSGVDAKGASSSRRKLAPYRTNSHSPFLFKKTNTLAAEHDNHSGIRYCAHCSYQRILPTCLSCRRSLCLCRLFVDLRRTLEDLR